MEKRLQSIKLPRDLTLGGTKPRRTFTPNLNITRNKEKNKEFIIKTEDKQKYNKRNSRNNKKFEQHERFIQSSGIFSDGMGTDVNKRSRNERVYTPKDDVPNLMPIPKVKKDEWQVDNESETNVYDIIMGNRDVYDEFEKLPFAPITWNEADLKETKVPISVKAEVEVKHSENVQLDLNRLKIETSLMPKQFQETDNFTDYKPALTLWKMPDSFAGKGLSDDPSIRTLFDYKLAEMLEGQIGKMVVRKSGKIEVFIGCVKYQIEPSHLESFTERIIQLDIRNASESTSVALGELQDRFVLNPDWEYLLRNS